MEALESLEHLSVEAYLAGEPKSEVRHEYIGGAVYAMAGGSEQHNLLSGRIYAACLDHLRGKPCRVFIADVKLRVQIGAVDIFYYPDVMVVCDPRDTDPYAKRFPQVLVEVLSPETERTDRREKFLSYTHIATLQEYVLVAQDKVEVTVFRRANQWQPEVLRRADQSLRLASLELTLPVATIYEDVQPPAAH